MELSEFRKKVVKAEERNITLRLQTPMALKRLGGGLRNTSGLILGNLSLSIS